MGWAAFYPSYASGSAALLPNQLQRSVEGVELPRHSLADRMLFSIERGRTSQVVLLFSASPRAGAERPRAKPILIFEDG